MSVQEQSSAFAVDGQQLVATLLAPPGQQGRLPGVLFLHGWGGNQEQYLQSAREIAALGCVCLTFDLRGHAETAPQHDSVTREDNLHDALAAYDLLAAHPRIDKSCIAAVGASYGAYLGAILTLMRPVRLLALRAPALYKDEGWGIPKRQLHVDPDFAAYRRQSLRAADNRALGACSQFRGDALLVESEKDEVIPHPATANYVAALANAHSLTYRVIEGADHGLTQKPWEEAYTNLLVGWLAEMFRSARTGPVSDSPQAL